MTMADQQVVLPEEQEFFKLNEVCKLANVQPYMLRFWGTEFVQLEAAKSGTGQRLYSRHQVQVILEIRKLLFDEGLTIAGARKRVASLQEKGELPTPEVPTIQEETPTPPSPKQPATAEAVSQPAPAESPSPDRKASQAKPARAKKPAIQEEPEPEKRSPKGATSGDVGKKGEAQAQPLLATLKDVRTEVAKILADLKTAS
jgi:DNA-binding transcriptional MerR regulator